MKKLKIFLVLSFYALYQIRAQSNIPAIPKPTDFSIPSSPAFSLLDVNPGKINKPGFVRDFKLDWVIKENKLSPDIAIEAQPVWLIFYDQVSYKEYQEKSWFEKSLSTLSASVANVRKDSISSLALAFKINLFSSYDPLSDYELVKKVAREDPEEIKNIIQKLNGINLQLQENNLAAEIKTQLQKESDHLTKILETRDNIEKGEIQKILQEKFKKAHWNDAKVDVGYGLIENYKSSALDNLSFISGGNAVWINGCCGIGKEALVTCLFRYMNIQKKENYFAGINFRYGGSILNFFVEYVYEKVSAGEKNTIAYGGDYRIGENIAIQFGLRTEYDKNLTLSNLKPLINVNWLLN